MIYTFYSYKGGVGRSMALVNVAELSYRAGLKVLMVDWDLEAPGLERFLPVPTDKVLEHPGVMDMLLEYRQRMAQLPSQGAKAGELALPLDGIELYLLDMYPGERGKGRLWLIPAGKRAGEHFAHYASLVRTFDWHDFYQNWEGELFFEWLRRQFLDLADMVLVDSRTGVTEIGGVCAYQLADVVVMFCSPNQQSLDGTYEMARNFKRPEVRELRRGRSLEVLVIPARVEDRAEQRLLNEFRGQFVKRFDNFAPEALKGEPYSLWQLKIPHVPYYAFNEIVAVREKGEARSEDMVEAFTSLVGAMARLAPLETSVRALTTLVTASEIQKGLLTDAKLSLSRALDLMADAHREEAELLFKEAERLLRRVIAKDPINVQAHFIYARLLESLQQYDQATVEYQEALRLDPADATIQAAYEAMQEKRQRAEELAKILEAAKAEAPVPPVPVPEVEEERTRAKIAPKMEETPPIEEVPVEAEMPSLQQADRYWAIGFFRVEQEDLAGAEEAFQQALALAPHHTEALKVYSLLLMDQQRYAEAEEYLATLIEVDPSAVDTYLAGHPTDTSPPLLTLRGSLHVRRGELEAAEPLLRKAVALEPERVERIVAYARLLAALNRSQEAIEWLRDALDRGLDDAALHREYARLMAEQSQYDEVERHLKRALALEPDDPETLTLWDELQADLEAYQAAYGYMALARIKAREGMINEAEALFEEALEIDGNHLPTLKAYATFLEEQGRFSDAERMWAMVAARVPEEAEAHFQAILDARGENSETLNGLARVLIQLDRLAEAEAQLRRSLALAPGNPETLHLLVDMLGKLDRGREAEALLGDNLTIVGADPKLSLQYAQLLATRRDYDRARKFYRRAQELAPYDEEIVKSWEAVRERIAQFDRANLDMALGWSEAQAGNYAEAERLYQEALEIDPEHVPTLRRYAHLLEDAGRPMEASSYLIRLARLDPEAAEEHYRSRLPKLEDNVEGRCAYACFLQSLGRLTEAGEQFRLALDVQPAYLPALNPYIDLLLQEGKAREAETALKHAVDQGDVAAEIHWRYGNLLAERHRYDLAGPHLARAVALSDDVRFRESYEQITEKLGQVRTAELAWALALETVEADPVEAESLFREAYAACSDHIPTLVDYGQFLLQRGRREEALSYLEEAVRLDPYEERAARLRAELEAAPPEPASPEEEGSPDG